MKSRVKVLLGVLSSLLLLALLAWTGTFLYWHFRIRGAIQVLESLQSKDARIVEREAAAFRVMGAGCRCLPYLVRSLDPEKDVDYLMFSSFVIAWVMECPGAPVEGAWSTELSEQAVRQEIMFSDSSQDRRRKIELIRSWWKEHGAEHHQWWRVWSSNCR